MVSTSGINGGIERSRRPIGLDPPQKRGYLAVEKMHCTPLPANDQKSESRDESLATASPTGTIRVTPAYAETETLKCDSRE